MFLSTTKRNANWDRKSARAKGRNTRSFRPSLERLEDRALLAVNWTNLINGMDGNLSALADPSTGVGANNAINKLPVLGATLSSLVAQQNNPFTDLRHAVDGGLANPTDDQATMSSR